MSVFMSREGGISIFRVGIFMGIVGLLVIVGGFVLLEFERAARRSPLNVDVYPGAMQIHQEDGSNSRVRGFQVAGSDDGTIGAVVGHYQAELNSYYGNDPRDPGRELCDRNPDEGEFPGFEPGNGTIAFEFYCVFDDDSDLAGQRQTTIRIYPGNRDDTDTDGFNSTNSTIIEYTEFWVP